MRYRRQYRVKGRTWKVVWHPMTEDAAAGITFKTREFVIDPIVRTYPEWQQREILAHEISHMLLDTNDNPPNHPTRCFSHNGLARHWVKVDQIMRTGTDGS